MRIEGTTEYSSNNSGGRWWLSDDDWHNLEAAGWKIQWGMAYFCNSTLNKEVQNKPDQPCEGKCQGHYAPAADESQRWLRSLARGATREGLTLGEAIEEWERVTGQDSSVLGCNCCGAPHSFAFDGEDDSRDSYYPHSGGYGRRYGE